MLVVGAVRLSVWTGEGEAFGSLCEFQRRLILTSRPLVVFGCESSINILGILHAHELRWSMLKDGCLAAWRELPAIRLGDEGGPPGLSLHKRLHGRKLISSVLSRWRTLSAILIVIFCLRLTHLPFRLLLW